MRPPARFWGWRFFPLPDAAAVPAVLVKEWLEHLLWVWGLPERIRVDNGWPWGSSRDLPPVLSLWLMGLGIEMVWNRPAHPQQNGVVERFNGLLEQWGEPQSCQSWQAWTNNVARTVEVQRELYPAVAGKSRSVAYPELYQNRRRYSEQKKRGFSMEPVRQYFSSGIWKRLANKQGQISLYHRPFSVGRKRAGQTLFVRLDAETNEWVVRDAQGNEVKRHLASELCPERIQALDISYLKPNERRRHEQRPNPAAFYAT